MLTWCLSIMLYSVFLNISFYFFGLLLLFVIRGAHPKANCVVCTRHIPKGFILVVGEDGNVSITWTLSGDI